MNWLLGAIGLLCAAHFIRMMRWRLFVEIYEEPKDYVLLNALSWGYLVNFLVPFKLGDFVRAFLAGRKMKNSYSLALSTIIVDRYLDVISVGIMFLLFSFTEFNSELVMEGIQFYFVISVLLILVAAMAFIGSGWIKKIVRAVARIFNEKIEFNILKISYSLIRNFKDLCVEIPKGKLAIRTVAMWGLYLLSYYCFARYLQVTGMQVQWLDIFLLFFSKNSLDAGTLNLAYSTQEIIQSFPFVMGIYSVVPLLILALFSKVLKRERYQHDTEEAGRTYVNMLPHLDSKERLAFLEEYFTNEKREYLAHYLKVNQNIFIIRDYSAGSRATTMLCSDSENTFFRKYAFGDEGKKLAVQLKWLLFYQKKLPLPEILRYETEDSCCYYDMPYLDGAMGFFQYIHTGTVQQAERILTKILDTIENQLHEKECALMNAADFTMYFREKVQKNLGTIMKCRQLRALEEYDSILINGNEYPTLHTYAEWLSESVLKDIFANDRQQSIHGDLTVENIVCVREAGKPDWFYLIDPNPGGGYSCGNLDYAKLLQSLHGGYEFLMSNSTIHVSEDRISFVYARSSAYEYLYEQYRKWMSERFSKGKIKSIYFHEIIHWLRLMPYKIEKSTDKAILCYARMLIVIKEIVDMYAGEAEE